MVGRQRWGTAKRFGLPVAAAGHAQARSDHPLGWDVERQAISPGRVGSARHHGSGPDRSVSQLRLSLLFGRSRRRSFIAAAPLGGWRRLGWTEAVRASHTRSGRRNELRQLPQTRSRTESGKRRRPDGGGSGELALIAMPVMEPYPLAAPRQSSAFVYRQINHRSAPIAAITNLGVEI